jgi:hypothetical protein
MKTDSTNINRTLARIRLLRLSLALGYAMAAIAVAWISIAGIVYCVLKAQWLPAIFILLARRDLVRWMDGESHRLGDQEDPLTQSRQ